MVSKKTSAKKGQKRNFRSSKKAKNPKTLRQDKAFANLKKTLKGMSE